MAEKCLNVSRAVNKRGDGRGMTRKYPSGAKCSVDGCEYSKRLVRGWCPLHYKRWKRNGDPTKTVVDVGACSTKCRIDGCDKLVVGRKLCNTHWARWRANPGITDAEMAFSPKRVECWIREHKVWRGTDCLIWPFYRMPNGYGQGAWDGVRTIASRAMCMAAHGEPESPDLEAAHSCGKGHEGCVNPMHLRWATNAENQMDRVVHGTSNRGARHGMAKLTPIDVLGIRLLAGSWTLRAVATEFGVSQANIWHIKSGRSWEWF